MQVTGGKNPKRGCVFVQFSGVNARKNCPGAIYRNFVVMGRGDRKPLHEHMRPRSQGLSSSNSDPGNEVGARETPIQNGKATAM